MLIDDQTTLSILLTGSTHYLRLGPDAEAAVYYGADGRSGMLMPDGKRQAGQWQLTPTGYHVDWQDGRSADWQIDAEPGRMAYCNAGGVERAVLVRIVPGDDAGFTRMPA
ncbi:MAG TPA: hypothetical protein VGM83_11715 [Devosiaceae bacterium]|jgi:hypothetical protein